MQRKLFCYSSEYIHCLLCQTFCIFQENSVIFLNLFEYVLGGFYFIFNGINVITCIVNSEPFFPLGRTLADLHCYEYEFQYTLFSFNCCIYVVAYNCQIICICVYFLVNPLKTIDIIWSKHNSNPPVICVSRFLNGNTSFI